LISEPNDPAFTRRERARYCRDCRTTSTLIWTKKKGERKGKRLSQNGLRREKWTQKRLVV